MDYDTWKESVGNPHQAEGGDCAFCFGCGEVDDSLYGDGSKAQPCKHCDGSGECGCSECDDHKRECEEAEQADAANDQEACQ